MNRLVFAALFLVACANHPEPCPTDACSTRRWQGEHRGGELGFRFSSPLDMNGDGISDLAAGSRFSDIDGAADVGVVYAWSGVSGDRILAWDGTDALGLFGHVTLAVPDLDADGLADVLASAPNRPGGGLVAARSPESGRILWISDGTGALGWHVAITDDHDGDGAPELLVGAPSTQQPRVELRSGRTGAIIRSYDGLSETFGFYVASIADLDGDARDEVFVGAPLHSSETGTQVGAAFVIGSGSGELLLSFLGEDEGGRFGENLTGIPDIDGDGRDDLVVGAAYTNAPGQVGQVYVFSSATGALLHRLVGSQPGAIYGRMVARVYDVDEDGTDDLAIAAPWRRVDGIDRAGYFEVRSGRTMEIIASVAGNRANAWLGWHIAPAERMIDGTRRGILVSSILSEENGIPGAGRVELYELQTQ